MQVSAVIGANYGDEGKGLMTDYLCRQKKADLVVRFNGGAQAGHTVVTPDGRRHVFSHIGSGYFAGASTYLSEFFVSNPILFKKEYTALQVPATYKIFVDPRSHITTPFDMIANQIKELYRKQAAHGSCGVGFGETLDRVEDDGITLTYFDIRIEPTSTLRRYLNRIADYWIGSLSSYCTQELDSLFDLLSNNRSRIIDQFLLDIDFFITHTQAPTYKFPAYTYAIFEGAQGLGLDQHMGRFPYVTRSNTGLRNIIYLQRQMGFDIDEVVYVTRSYLTRHGNDPYFQDEPFPLSVIDMTNKPNQFQGELKYAPIYDQCVLDRIQLDIRANSGGLPLQRTLAVTHVDQIPCTLSAKYISRGPTHEDVQVY